MKVSGYFTNPAALSFVKETARADPIDGNMGHIAVLNVA
jgi:hypothetical protein